MSKYRYEIKDGKRIGSIETEHGTITLPTFMPVTTYGDKYPLDKMVQPYLKRMSQCLMVSHFYAQGMNSRPHMPIFIDSGGFASLFEGAEIIEHDEYACILTKDGDEIHPLKVLEFQESHADLGATLDFIIPPNIDLKEAQHRQDLTIKNALYVQKHARAKNLMLYGSLQSWDEKSARSCARIYADAGFEGIAIGGLVPRSKDKEYMKNTVRAVREEAPNCAIHVFGCGNTEIIPVLISLGADSFDSSSYVRNAADTRTSNSKSSLGIHTNLYDAVNQLFELNSVISGVSTTITDVIPNTCLCSV